MRPLLRRYPVLGRSLPHETLADLPTPVERLDRLGASLGVPGLYVKRDDLTGRVYGGNKVRKLEFLLAEARRRGAREVMTFGFAGSNHCLATAIYAQHCGLRSISMLLPQPTADYVRVNLLTSHAHGAELHLYRDMRGITAGTLAQLALHTARTWRPPMTIPAGGSSPLGIVAMVNAGIELADQVLAGELPRPDRLYVPFGSAGSAVGLSIGLRLAGLPTRVVPILVVDRRLKDERTMARVYRQTMALLRRHDPGIPDLDLPLDLHLDDRFLGPGYGHFTAAGRDAVERLDHEEGLRLEGTYSGKAMAALIADAKDGRLEGQNVLFWLTYNSRALDRVSSDVDYRDLPRSFHPYFEA